VSVLRKRKKKTNLIKDIYSSKSRASHGSKQTKNKDLKNENEYVLHRRAFRIAVIYSTVLLFILWWIPLIGPMLAGYAGGRKASKKWLAIKVVIIPVIIIAIIANLFQFGLLPRLDMGREIGLFFMTFTPGIYHSLAPYIIPVIFAFGVIHSALGIGSNGYLVITLITAYMGGLVSERKTSSTDSINNKKISKTTSGKYKEEKDDNNRFLYRKRNESSEGGFEKITDRLRKITMRTKSSHGKYVANIEDFPMKKEKEGWIRKDGVRSSESGTRANDDNQNPRPRFVTRTTANSSNVEAENTHRRSITSGTVSGIGSKSKNSIYLPRETELNDVDNVRRTTYNKKPPMSRSIIDRAVKSYSHEANINRKNEKSNLNNDQQCQMGTTHNYRQRDWDSL